MNFEFSAAIWYWKGPSPYHFLTVPETQSRELKDIVHLVTYGWGMIPVQVWIGSTHFTTSLFHKDGRYVLPIKDSVRKAEDLEEGDHVTARIEVKVNVNACGETERHPEPAPRIESLHALDDIGNDANLELFGDHDKGEDVGPVG